MPEDTLGINLFSSGNLHSVQEPSASDGLQPAPDNTSSLRTGSLL